MMGEEMEIAAVENSGGVAGRHPSSPPLSSSRHEQGGRPTCSYLPDVGGSDSGKRIGLVKSDRAENASVDGVPEGEGAVGRQDFWEAGRPLPSGPASSRPLVPCSSPSGWWKQTWNCYA